MPTLTYYVSAVDGTYGTMDPATLQAGQTFGSQGATVCVILLITKTDGNLFCGHMACGISGLPGNEQIIKTKTAELLDLALGDDNKGQPWEITGSSSDATNQWIRAAMTAWFTTAATQNSNANTDAYFSSTANGITTTLSNNMSDAGSQEVNDGSFSIEP